MHVSLYTIHRLARLLLICISVMVFMLASTQSATAHPMGNFSVNRYSRLTLMDDAIALDYVLDMAEIPTHAERTKMDSDGNGVISATEQQTYLATVQAALSTDLVLMVDSQPMTWTPVDATLIFASGQADLPTLRMTFRFETALAGAGRNHALDYHAQAYDGRLGWQEVIVVTADNASLLAANVPQVDISDALRSYPDDLLQNPPSINRASARWSVDPGVGQVGTIGTTTGDGTSATISTNTDSTNTDSANTDNVNRDPVQSFLARARTMEDREGRYMASLIALPELGPWAILLALLGAFFWGAVHALSPGHGKTIVAAYLVGARGTFAHAAFLGATTTITHTLGVFALGLVTLFASQYILPEQLYPYLSAISGALIVTIGVSIGWQRWRGLRHNREAHEHPHSHEHHSHIDHNHTDHSHEAHSHTQHEHDHGDGHPHSHMPPGADGRPLTWRNLLALGVSGGLLPCPSALVVLLGAIALGRVTLGLVLIVVFSLGLATVLTAIGLVLLRARTLFARIPDSGRYARYLTVASAAFITLVGLGITYQALIETGLLRVLV